MDYPDNCLRGIPNDGFLTDDKKGVQSSLFAYNLSDPRADGWIEISINWEDNDQAIPFTLAQNKENGEPKFPSGVAVLPRDRIDAMLMFPRVKTLLLYERQEKVNENPYHGNILYKEDISKQDKRTVSGMLAMAAAVAEVLPE